MRLITIAAIAAGFAAIAGAAAADASDAEFLKASRCRGIAEGQGVTDTASLDAFLKAEKRTRQSSVLDRAKNEQTNAKREAKTTNEERRERLTKEFNGPCQAYKS